MSSAPMRPAPRAPQSVTPLRTRSRTLPANLREDVEEEIRELCTLYGIESRPASASESSSARDKRHKQLRNLVQKRKAERLAQLESRGFARVVAAASRREDLAGAAGGTFEATDFQKFAL